MDPLISSNKRILVIDDESTIRELIADALSEVGFEVEVAENGAAALEVVRRWPPHAIVLDLMMPRLDGSGFVELLRLNPEFQSVPVLLVSATYAPEEIAERIGARACLTKPFELDHLIELVGELAGTPTPRTALADSAVIEGLALPEPDALPLGDLAIQLPESNQGI